ncbi:peptidoglycan DD-metalloendopeptidase family protein [uncultured Sneathia sp.]|uniref:murein hydrolase activator EnvC family protein n=1 Tax=uncultured Sneathia sp. TaxID=278067 RepID=UPI00259493ED|nr:peptidoglycan DD-metalloendopeptidase family protein [uncultured Sneathia sp.]
MKITGKCSVLLLSLALSIPYMTFSDARIDKNKRRIAQINRQVTQNRNLIIKNNRQIVVTKRTQASLQSEINDLNFQINKLQKEYNVLEQRYIELLKAIGANEKDIKASISKIQSSNAEIKVNKDEYNTKIRNYDLIRRARNINQNSGLVGARRDKLRHDAHAILDLQINKIKGIETYKKGVEQDKIKVEGIKQKNQSEATKVMSARNDLENKKKELNTAVARKNKAVAELRDLQNKLRKENITIEKNNSKLASERNRLEAQINAIIRQNAIRQQQLERQRQLALRRKQQQGSARHENINVSQEPINVVKGTGSLIYPIRGRVVVGFGTEKVQGLKSKGIEILGTLGQSVSAADTGTVIYSGSLGGLGRVVIISHGSLITVYGNLASIRVSRNEAVRKGQSIGTLGRDSETKKPTLYFEVRHGVNIVNPMSYL